jgi:SSS family solute:Na+ symporter
MLDLGWNYTWASVMIGVVAHVIVLVVGYFASLFFPPHKNLKTEWTYWGWRETRRNIGDEKILPATMEASS